MNGDAGTGLSAWFQGLQEQDQALAPPFESMVATAPVRRSHAGATRGWVAGGLFAAASAVLFVMVQRPGLPPELDTTALLAWQSPTDFLLASQDGSLARLGWTAEPTAILGLPSIPRAPRGRAAGHY